MVTPFTLPKIDNIIISVQNKKENQMANVFLRGIAQGNIFYGRVNERKKLKQNIDNRSHTVLIAPRRYGKTSLITEVLCKNKIDHAWINFMTITSSEDLQIKLLQKIGDLMVKVVPNVEKLKILLAKYFSKLKPEIIFGAAGTSFSLKFSQGQGEQEGIGETLASLDNLAQELNIRLVVVFDEFQEILRIEEDATLQGAIRHAVERAKQITYLFSGGLPKPLRRMFNGKENPPYPLTAIMEVGKIAADEYISYINNAALEKWNEPLNSDVSGKILTYSDRYPKYVNVLCGAIWEANTKPTAALVDEAWRSYVLSRKTDITEVLSDLTLNQRRLLQWLCFKPTAELYKKENLAKLKMSQSSVQKSIAVLLEKDFVIEESGIYKVLDVILISYFRMF